MNLCVLGNARARFVDRAHRAQCAIIVAFSIVFFCSLKTWAVPSQIANAAEKGDGPKVRALIQNHADVNAAQVDDTTALHWAVRNDDLETVKSLLAAGANASATNRYGVPPLNLACINGDESIVRALLEAGADANTTLRGGESVLMTAARTGRVGPVKALLERGAKVDAPDRKDQTALMWAAAEGQAEVVDLLIDSGADVHHRLRSGFTAFLFAARNGRIDVVKTLLKHGVDPNEAIETKHGGGRAPRNGTSALILAVENGHFELAMDLVKAGADPNDERSGFTPLHVITWVRKPDRGDDLSGQPPPDTTGNLTSTDFVRQLVAAGADINARLARGDSGRGKLSMVGATPFLLASKTADVELMKLFVELGADPKIPNANGSTPLMAAAGLGCLAPIEVAGTEAECVDAVTYLMSLGADVNVVDKNGETAMHGAAYKSLPKMVQLLADHGARIDIWQQKDKWGWTPIMIAEGFRPGNFKPSFETLKALQNVLRAAGVEPPPPTPRLGSD